MSLLFEWDEKKAKTNLEKHGVSFEDATTIFGDTLSITINDPLHPDSEERFITIGMSYFQKVLVVVHADRNDKIRIISARKATSKERKKYEEAK